jgi:L-Ala-D/L-Glu epimerase
LRELSVVTESWPLAVPFRISRGTKVAADVVVVEIREGGVVGRGESVPYARYGESGDSVLHQVADVREAVEHGLDRAGLATRLKAGAARNAIDCALWDLESRRSARSVASLLGAGEISELPSALTVSLDTPERMAEAAARLAGVRLLKVKVDGSDPEAQLRAVHRAAPEARLVVDANEGWTLPLLRAMQPVLVETGVALLEQPLPAAEDDALAGFVPAVPICADESCHTAADLPRLRGRYQAVNVKLDKTGGLTGALELVAGARAAGFRVMVGCMVGTSLGIAPAMHVAREAEFVDLDGPLWLARDRAGGVTFTAGRVRPPAPGFWGDGAHAS